MDADRGSVVDAATDLAGLRVLDFSTGIAGPYCTKLLTDAGADVVKVEPAGGDPLRSWSATGGAVDSDGAALFSFLNAGKRSVSGASTDPGVGALVAEADVVVEAHGLAVDAGERLDVPSLRARHPSLVVVSITPYGTTGPWCDRAATEFTLQAECGSLGLRGVPGRPPHQAGGRIAEWAAGAFAAFAALAAVTGVRRRGKGTHVDLSVLEAANLVFANFSEPMNRLMNGGPEDPDHAFLTPTVETPSIEPSADGWVGFCTNARQQFNDFLVLIDRADLLADDDIGTVAGRGRRFAEWTATVHGWTSSRSTSEIIEQASLLRIPVSDVCSGETVTEHEQLVARRVYGPDATGRFLRPRRPYLVDGAEPPPPRRAPDPPEPVAHPAGAVFAPRPARETIAEPGDPVALPFEGLTVLDVTAWWAGPAATHLLATLGAEVIHVESTERPDGMRMIGGPMAAHYRQWWDASPHFLAANTNKLGITLDLTHPTGIELLEGLLARSDVVVENFTPRVLDNFGLSWEWVKRVNPRAILVRMPAYGLTGPWRDRPGFAQNIEQLSGLAWVTGHLDDQPRVPRGPCDPVAGVHAAIALVVALARRHRSGHGHLVEVPLCDVALNIAAEQVVEFSAYGNRMERQGNRSPGVAPQGLYPCADTGTPTAGWLALSVATDAQWRALRMVMGEPRWATNPSLDTMVGRSLAHDRIDERLAAWTRPRHRAALVGQLQAAGVPAAEVADPARLIQRNPQFRHRTFFERPDHPVVGPMPLPALPFRMDGVDRWLRTAAPTLGRDNEDVLGGMLGLTAEDLGQLTAAAVIGTEFAGARRS